MKGDFTENLSWIYSIYVGGFAVFVIAMALLEQLGLPPKFILWSYMALTILVYAFIGVMSRTTRVSQYYVAGRSVPAIYNGMATGADWMSGASFIGMAGSLYVLGYDGLAFVLGWTGGYVLVAVLLAPYLRKFGAYTVPDFLGTRYGGNLPRLLGIIVLFAASFTYLTAQIYASGIIASRFLGIDFQIAVFAGLAGILVCSMLGGMRAVTWTQVAQYIVLIIAYLTPVIWMSNVQGFGIIPHFNYGDAIARIAELEQQLGVGVLLPTESFPGQKALVNLHNNPSGGPLAEWKFFTLTLCMMTGTASLPHILMRYFTTPSVRDARKSVAWSLLFIFLLYFTAPALATLTKLQLLDPNLATSLFGKSIEEVMNLTWIQKWSAVGMLTVSDSNGDGILQINELFMRSGIVVLATPEIAGLPAVISGLVAAGGMAAAMSTADGLLLAIANALSHDLYYKIIDPKADTKHRLIVARVLLLVIGAAAAFVASMKLTGILGAVAWAFCFAASGLFFPLVLGIWWKRANRAGAIAGMILGFSAGAGYLIYIQNGGTQILGLDGLRFAIIGMPVSLVAMVVVSLMTEEPDAETQAMVDAIRDPTGRAILAEEH